MTVLWTSTPAARPHSLALAQLRHLLPARPSARNVAWSSRNLIAFVWPPTWPPASGAPTVVLSHRIAVMDANAPGAIVALLPALHHSMPTHVLWHPSGTHLLTADEDGRVAVWRMRGSASDWELAGELALQEQPAAVAWIPNERTLHAATAVSDEVRRALSSDAPQLPAAFEAEDLGPVHPLGSVCFALVTSTGRFVIACDAPSGELLTSERALLGTDADGALVPHADLAVQLGGRVLIAMHVTRPDLLPSEVLVYDVAATALPTTPMAWTLDVTPHGCVRLASLSADEQLVRVCLLRRKNEELRLLVFTSAPTADSGFVTRVACFESSWASVPLHSVFNFTSVPPDHAVWVPLRDERLSMASFLVASQFTSDGRGLLALMFADGSVQLRSIATFELLFTVEAVPQLTGNPLHAGGRSLVANDLPAISLAFSPNDAAFVQAFSNGELRVSLLPAACVFPLSASVASNGDGAHMDVSSAMPEDDAAIAFAYALLATMERATDAWDLLQHVAQLAADTKRSPEALAYDVARVMFFYYRQYIRQLESRQFWSKLMRLYRSTGTMHVQVSDCYSVVQLIFIHDVLLSHLNDPVGAQQRITSVLRSGESLDKLTLTSKFDPASFWTLVPLASWLIDFAIYALYNLNYVVMRHEFAGDKATGEGVVVDTTIPAVAVLLAGEPLMYLNQGLLLCYVLSVQIHGKKQEFAGSPEAMFYNALETIVARPHFSITLLVEKLRGLPTIDHAATASRLQLAQEHVQLIGTCLQATTPSSAKSANAPPFSIDGVEGKLHLLRHLQEHLELPWQDPVGDTARLDIAREFAHVDALAFSTTEPETVSASLPDDVRNDCVRHTKLNRAYLVAQQAVQCLRCYRLTGVLPPKGATAHAIHWYSVSHSACVCGGLWAALPGTAPPRPALA